MPKVAIVMGSVSDLDVVKPTIEILKKFDVEAEVRVISAHRTPDLAHDFAKNAVDNNIEVIICAAGKAAHLGGVIASYTPIPVIGLPVKSSTMDGLDSLLSMVQMPSGIPVACVAINGGLNAGLLAIQILSVKYPNLMKKMQDYKISMAEKIKNEDEKLQKELN
ncbi:MAG: 5-(carboxyamino)imidazole ribonucleotide mutase [Clostridia bacterium]|nr:5-(carboxyamino)imidazole ribonucleotide mutase [Clostridia bacterium]MDE6471458.1 5-(carboxyamino)imidazole ribonucleotide mutase [Clostridia bacterium]